MDFLSHWLEMKNSYAGICDETAMLAFILVASLEGESYAIH
jgi:hypothetical protein